MTAGGIGMEEGFLGDDQVDAICREAIDKWRPDGKDVLVLIPDFTRTCPLPLIFRVLYRYLESRARTLDFLVALGTHPPMSEEEICRLVGITPQQLRTEFGRARFFNHMWRDPAHLVEIGRLPSKNIAAVTEGLFEMDVPITCNRMVTDHDLTIIAGPVFPHEVVGFSGGNKYLFPGVAGREIIDFFHWLGAVITNREIIGRKWTPVRKVVDAAAALLNVERKAFCMVVTHDGLSGLYYGSPEDAWSAAADLSEKTHIVHTDRLYHTILARAPDMYDDLWTGGKCMYKTEPTVAQGGKVIIYAPHITEVSSVHGRILEEIGYHTRDFFLAQWDRYKHYPWGVLAHSTHVKGAGTYRDGIETPYAEVILATGIPENVCRKINLGYMDCDRIDVSEYDGRESDGILYVPKAGEILYRHG